MSLLEDVRAWIADDVDPGDAAELQALLDAGDLDELAERFAGPLQFGTAGLRGPLRAGPAGMNATVVRRAAAGLAAWLDGHGFRGGIVVVGYDARHRSAEFARDSAAVLGAAGFDARLLPGPLPTPVTAYAVRRFGAAAGVMVTASHNPPRDNGYKVYGADGAQIVSPVDAEIEAAIRSVGSTHDVPLGPFTDVGSDVLDSYVRAVVELAPPGPRELTIVHTAMHGVGTRLVTEVLAGAGFTRVLPVAAQAEPDPDFPTVSFPNPEEPGALDLALDLAVAESADIVIANDPDADRCAVAVPYDGVWTVLRGDQVGVLLADRLLSLGVRGTYATTIVSSSMLSALAAEAGVPYVETLTGFKWITRAAPDLAYGYEEALGYAVAPSLVLDKDGISAALVVATYAAELQAAGSSLWQRLEQLYARFGRYATDQLSVRVEDLGLIADMMARLRSGPPASLLGRAVGAEDLLPLTDAVRLSGDGVRVVVRPSGTEPKLKAYLQVVVGSAAEAESALSSLRAEISSALGL